MSNPMPRLAFLRKKSGKCKHGHDFSTDNVYRYGGYRQCKRCRALRQKEYRKRKKLGKEISNKNEKKFDKEK